MSLSHRITSIATAIGLGAVLLLDPYTFSASTSHFRLPAPWWQTLLAITELALLIGFVAAVWKAKRRPAIVILGLGTGLNLAANTMYVVRDGLSRFSVAFGTGELLSVYLLTIAARLALLVMLALAGEEQGPRGGA